MRYQITHRTSYQYASLVRDSFNEVRLHPVSNEHQTVESFLLKVLPATRLRQYHDFCSNIVYHFEIPEPHNTLSIESHLRIQTHAPAIPALDATPWPLARIGEAARMARCYDFLQISRYVDADPETWRLAIDVIQGVSDTWQAALRLMHFVHNHITYQANATSVHTHMRQVMAERKGVCQDMAHVMIGLCRSLKIPAIYVSGYLATETASATHAWIEVYLPGLGWKGLDPTHNRVADQTYVKIAVGRDYSDVPPFAGHYKGTQNRTMKVEVSVEALNFPGASGPN